MDRLNIQTDVLITVSIVFICIVVGIGVIVGYCIS